MLTSAELRAEAERCRRLARGVGDDLTTSRLAELASKYSAEADLLERKERRQFAGAASR
jgi:hypothetical protein